MRTIWIIILLLLLAGTTQATPGTDTTQVNRFREFCSTTLKSKIDSITKEYQQTGKLNDYSLFVDYGDNPPVNTIAEKANGYQPGISLTDPRVIEFKQNLTALNNNSTSYKIVYVNICAWNVVFTKTVFGDTALDEVNFKNFLKPGYSNFDDQFDNSKSKARSVITTAFPDTPINLLFVVDCDFKFWHLTNPDYAVNSEAPLRISLAERSYLSFYPYHFNSNIASSVKSEYERIFKIFFEYVKGKEYPVQHCANCYWLNYCYDGIKKGLEKYKIYDNILSISNTDSMKAYFSANFGSDAAMYKALSLQQIIHIFKVLAKGYFDDNPTNIMLNCMINCQDDLRKQMLDSLAFARLYDGSSNLQRAIFRNIGGENLGRYLVVTTQLANKVFENYTSEEDAMAKMAFIKLKPGGFLGSTILNDIDDATGEIALYNLSGRQFVKMHPFKKVLVTITEDYSYRNFIWKRGEYKNIPAIVAYGLFNHETNKRLWQYLNTAVDVGLLFVGGGEIKYLFKAGNLLKAFTSRAMAKNIITEIFVVKGAFDLVITDVLSDVLRQSKVGQRILEKYNQYTMYTDMSYLGIAGLKSIYRNIKKDSRELIELKIFNGHPNTPGITTVDEIGVESFRPLTQNEIEETNRFLKDAEKQIEEKTGFFDDSYLDDATALASARSSVNHKLDDLLNLKPGLLSEDERRILDLDISNSSGKELIGYLEKQTGNNLEDAIDAWKRVYNNNAVSDLRKEPSLLNKVVKASNRLDIVLQSSNFNSVFTMLKGMPSTAARQLRYKDIASFKTRFIELHLSQKGVNINSIEDVAGDFEYLVYNHSQLQDIEKYIDEMEQTAEKFRGGAFGMELVHSPPPELQGKTLVRFEASIDDADGICDATSKCRFDLKFSDGPIAVFVETKNYSKTSVSAIINKPEFYNQFRAYISNPNLQKFDDIMYFFRKNDGIDELFIKGKFQQLFKNNTDDLFDVIWNNPNLRADVFGSIPPNPPPAFRIQKKQDLETIINSKGDKLFKFIKIK